jgi:hypothetical protein
MNTVAGMVTSEKVGSGEIDSEAHPFDEWMEAGRLTGVQGYVRQTLLEMRASISIARGESAILDP